MARERTDTHPLHVGSRIRKFNGEVQSQTQDTGEDYCLDFLGRESDHPLEIHKRFYQYPALSGDQGSFLSGYLYDNYAVDNPGFAYGHIAAGSIEPDDVFSATKVVSATNPSRTGTSVPLFLFETLREFPEMLRSVGSHKAAHRPGDSVVGHNFGWETLYRDFAAILDFQEYVDKRVLEWNALYSKGGLKRNQTVWSNHVGSSDPNVTLHSQGGSVHGSVETVTEYKKWVSVRWRPDDPINIPPQDEMIQRSRRLAHGWQLNPHDVWNALPWSWLIDYFANFGDVIGSARNDFGHHVESCCVMYKVETVSRVTIIDTPPGTTCTPGYSRISSKYRRLGTTGLTANVPLLGVQKLLNLLSIANGYENNKPYHG